MVKKWKGLVAISSLLGLQSTLETVIAYLTIALDEDNLAEISQFAYENEYGVYGEETRRICKHYLCKYGYDAAARVWLEVPVCLFEEVIMCDEFYVPTEWKGWEFIINLL
jgi:hypothetical protein